MHIKVLQTLRVFALRGAIDIKVLKDLKIRTETPLLTVARGPVPRELSNKTKNARIAKGNGRFFRRSMQCEGQALALRFVGTVWITTK